MYERNKVLATIPKTSNTTQCLELKYRRNENMTKGLLVVEFLLPPFYRMRVISREVTRQEWAVLELVLPSQQGMVSVSGNVMLNATVIKESCSSQPSCTTADLFQCDNGLCVTNTTSSSCSTSSRCGDFSDTKMDACRKCRISCNVVIKNVL